MRKEIFQNIKIPEGVETNIEGNTIIVKGPEGENRKKCKTAGLIFEKKDDKIIIGSKKATKKDKRMINTISSHVKNMIQGVQEKFEYQLKVCFSHFPMTIEIKNKELLIKNFLGERIPRKVKIPEEVDVKIEKDVIKVFSCNKELAGQTAADLEVATKIKKRDRRIFQDGIFIIKKPGRET